MSSSLSNNQRGIVAICAGMAAFTINDVLVKQILLHYPAGETIFLRGCMSCVLLFVVVLAMGHVRVLGTMSWTLAGRSICDGLATAGFIAALAHMKLANVAAVLQIAPLIIIALSVMLYRETVGWRRWTAIGVGFAGALLVIKPVPSSFDIWGLLAAAAALAGAMRDILTRRIGFQSPAIVVGFWGTVGITLLGMPFAAIEDWRPFATSDLALLFIAAAFIGIATYLLAVGFREADLSVVAPFRYSYLLTSAAGGFLVFGEWPDLLTVLGAVLIVAGGIYALHREAAQRRTLTATIRPAA